MTEYSCQEMIEVVTNYLDSALPTDEQERFERHLSRCAGCNTYLDQIRETIRQAGMVPDEESLPPAGRDRCSVPTLEARLERRAGLPAIVRAARRDCGARERARRRP
jgi:anti-sigma factor RsiW